MAVNTLKCNHLRPYTGLERVKYVKDSNRIWWDWELQCITSADAKLQLQIHRPHAHCLRAMVWSRSPTNQPISQTMHPRVVVQGSMARPNIFSCHRLTMWLKCSARVNASLCCKTSTLTQNNSTVAYSIVYTLDHGVWWAFFDLLELSKRTTAQHTLLTSLYRYVVIYELFTWVRLQQASYSSSVLDRRQANNKTQARTEKWS